MKILTILLSSILFISPAFGEEALSWNCKCDGNYCEENAETYSVEYNKETQVIKIESETLLYRASVAIYQSKKSGQTYMTLPQSHVLGEKTVEIQRNRDQIKIPILGKDLVCDLNPAN